MGKDIGKIYKHGKHQLSNPSIKAPVLLSLASKTPSSIELTMTSVPSVRDKKTNSGLCSKNSIQNDVSITNNDDTQSYETQRKKCIAFQPLQIKIIMNNVLLPHQ